MLVKVAHFVCTTGRSTSRIREGIYSGILDWMRCVIQCRGWIPGCSSDSCLEGPKLLHPLGQQIHAGHRQSRRTKENHRSAAGAKRRRCGRRRHCFIQVWMQEWHERNSLKSLQSRSLGPLAAYLRCVSECKGVLWSRHKSSMSARAHERSKPAVGRSFLRPGEFDRKMG